MVAIGETLGNAMGGIGSGAGQLIVILGKLIPALIIGAILGAIIWFGVLEDLLFFKHRVKLKKVVGDSFKWIDDKAMEKRLKNGAKIWRLKKLRIDCGIPPDEVLMHGQGGKIVAEGYLVNDNQIIWRKDGFNFKNISLEAKAALKKLKEGQELSDDEKQIINFKTNFQPVTTNDRIVIAQAMSEADFGKKDFTKLLEKMIPWAVVIVLFVLVIFGFKYYAGPLNDYGKQMVAAVAPITENNKITAEYLYAMKNDLTVVRADINFLKEQNKAGDKVINATMV